MPDIPTADRQALLDLYAALGQIRHNLATGFPVDDQLTFALDVTRRLAVTATTPDRRIPMPDTPTTTPWWITFGLGTPEGLTYTEVRVPSDLPLAEQDARVRAAAFDRYGRAWAFHYTGHRHYQQAIARYGLTLRETIDATTPQED